MSSKPLTTTGMRRARVLVVLGLAAMTLVGCSESRGSQDSQPRPWIGMTIELVEAVHVWHRVNPAVLQSFAGQTIPYATLTATPLEDGDPTINRLAGEVSEVHVPAHWADLGSDAPTVLVGLLQAESTVRTEAGIAVSYNATSISLHPARGDTLKTESAIVALATNNKSPVDTFFAESVQSNPSKFVNDVQTVIRTDVRKVPASQPAATSAIEEPTADPFDECRDLDQDYQATNQAALDALTARLEREGLYDQDNFIGPAGPPVVSGRLNIGLSRRNQQTIDWLAARALPTQICLSLPPAGYYDPPWELAELDLWKVTDRAPQRKFILLVKRPGQGCGGDPRGQMLEPIITYGTDKVEVALPLKILPWGTMFTCQGYKPPRFNLTLKEDLGARQLVLIQPPL